MRHMRISRPMRWMSCWCRCSASIAAATGSASAAATTIAASRSCASSSGRAKPLLVGIGYAAQEVDRIEPQAWDVKLDYVATERELSTARTRNPEDMRYWLMKTEPDEFSIDDLAKKKVEAWTGVRNYQARNFMRDGMQVGDGVLFYHSSCEVPGVAGIAEVATAAYPDPTAVRPQERLLRRREQARRAALVPRRREIQAQAEAHDRADRAQGRAPSSKGFRCSRAAIACRCCR